MNNPFNFFGKDKKKMMNEDTKNAENTKEEEVTVNSGEVKEEHQPAPEQLDAEMAEETAEMDETEKLRIEKNELHDKYIRLYSEFDNFRKRTIKERLDLMQSANQEMMAAVLPVLDDFERALRSMDQASDVASVKEGVDLIHSKFKNILYTKGLKPMESIGTEFNSDLHEAITNIPAPSEDMKGKVIDEVERGYMLGEKVIRYAKVVVGE